ncbi:PaaI family thioesterase [Roseovarius sp. M141]|uniref:PaaI family thioesterase n=1 Tax=Roseovarius sp. M141 TaxID=2583806 RepID=UPI0034E95043
MAKEFFAALPHAVALGLVSERIEGGCAVMSMPWAEKLVGDPATGVVHGGAVSTLMDTCCGAAAMSHPQAAGATATLGLRIDYMRPATPGQTIRAEATCHHVTRTVAFVRAVAVDDDAERPVATATGTFTVAGA